MAGQGHQFPGGFPNNVAGMRTNFGSGAMGTQMPSNMPNQLGGVMGSPINNPGMGGMGNQMVQSYGSGMNNQMNNIGMQQQTMPVVSASQSPGHVMGGGMPPGNTMPNMQGVGLGVPSGLSVGVGGTGVVSASNVSGTVPPIPPTPALTTPGTPAPPQQSKEFNTASLCRFGQETVQDIVSRTQEVFQTLKAIQVGKVLDPPNGTSQGANSSNEKKAKIQEQLRTIRLLFKRLRLIYDKCNENCQVPGMEYTHIESLIPLKDEPEHKGLDEKKSSEAYKAVCEERRILTKQVELKNKQLKEVINNLRTIIWEINVMLNMRRS